MYQVDSLLLILFGSLLLPFVVGPILVRFQSTHPTMPEFEPVNVGQLPPDIAESFIRFIHAMSADGFVFLGYFRQLAYMRGVGFHLALLRNHETDEIVYIIESFAKRNLVSIRQSQFEFCSEFADGTAVTTNNGKQPRLHKAAPQFKLSSFPEVNDPRLLCQLHRRLCHRFAPGAKSIMPTEGGPAFLLSYGTVKDVRRQADFGYYYLDEKANVYRPTWKGAYLMTWKLAWPVGTILRARMKRGARATMKSLGF